MIKTIDEKRQFSRDASSIFFLFVNTFEFTSINKLKKQKFDSELSSAEAVYVQINNFYSYEISVNELKNDIIMRYRNKNVSKYAILLKKFQSIHNAIYVSYDKQNRMNIRIQNVNRFDFSVQFIDMSHSSSCNSKEMILFEPTRQADANNMKTFVKIWIETS